MGSKVTQLVGRKLAEGLERMALREWLSGRLGTVEPPPYLLICPGQAAVLSEAREPSSEGVT